MGCEAQEAVDGSDETVSTPCPKSVRNRHFMLFDSLGLADILAATADTMAASLAAAPRLNFRS